MTIDIRKSINYVLDFRKIFFGWLQVSVPH